MLLGSFWQQPLTCDMSFFPWQIHTKRRNKLEHKRLNKLVFVSYNRKMAFRFLKLRELGSKGKKHNPLLLEEFQWENEWVDDSYELVYQGPGTDEAPGLTWGLVDETSGASEGLRGRNLPRAAARKRRSTSTSTITMSSTKKRKHARTAATETAAIILEEVPEDEELNEDVEMEDYSESDPHEMEDEEDEEDGEAGAGGSFEVDDDLL